MGIFGWSYPPGAENDPYAPYNQDAEDEPADDQITVVDVDEAYSVGAEVQDGAGADVVYFAVAEAGGKWFMSAIIDCDSASFVDSLVADDGPYDSEEEAIAAGLNCAVEWMISNDVGEYEIDSRIYDDGDIGEGATP